MDADGTIAMQVRVEDAASGAVGHRYTRVKPGEPRYKETLDHFSGLTRGNSKPILDDWP